MGSIPFYRKQCPTKSHRSRCLAVLLVMMHVTESDEIVGGILTFILVMLSVVQFEHLPGIVRRKHAPMPTTTTFGALESITR